MKTVTFQYVVELLLNMGCAYSITHTVSYEELRLEPDADSIDIKEAVEAWGMEEFLKNNVSSHVDIEET